MSRDPGCDSVDPDTILVGRYITSDGEIGQGFGIPVQALKRHLLITGETGAGKSTTATHVVTTTDTYTNGCTIAIDPKGGWTDMIARAHYAQTGTLENVLYFDTTTTLPAVSYFDIRPDVAAGRDRYRAVQSVAAQFLDLVDHLTESDQTAIRAPDVIKYLITALFDPVEGADAYTIHDLLTAIHRLRDTGTTPSTSAAWMERLLDGLDEGTAKRRKQIVSGSITRVEKVYGSGYIRPMRARPPSPTRSCRCSGGHSSGGRPTQPPARPCHRSPSRSMRCPHWVSITG
jgi:hypothetical protein